MSRGTSFALAGRTRKGLTLLWVALFVFSLAPPVGCARRTDACARGERTAGRYGRRIRDRRRPAREQREHEPGGITPAALINNPPMTDGHDWLDPNGVASAGGTSTSTTFLFEDATDPGDISAYAGGNKEDDTRDWDYVNSAGPNPKTDFKHIMAHAKVVGNSAFAYMGAERIVNNGDDGRRLRAEQEAVQGLPGRRAAQARPHRRRPADLARVLERRQQPDRDHLRDRQRRRTSRADRPSTSSRSATRRRSAPSAARPTSSTSRIRASATRSRPSTSPRRPSTSRSSASQTACPGFSSGHIRSRTGGDPASSQLKDTARPFDIDLNNCGKVTIVKDAIPKTRQNFDYTTTGGAPLADFSSTTTATTATPCRQTKTFELVVPGHLHGHRGRRGRLEADRSRLRRRELRRSTSTPASRRSRSATTNTSPARTPTPSSARSSSRSRPSLTAQPAASSSQATPRAPSVTAGRSSSTTCSPAPTPRPRTTRRRRSISARSPAMTTTATATSRPAPPPSDLAAGETIKCTFINVKRGSITIIKDAQPNDAQDFVFTTRACGRASASMTTPTPRAVEHVHRDATWPGSYTVTEATSAAGSSPV